MAVFDNSSLINLYASIPYLTVYINRGKCFFNFKYRGRKIKSVYCWQESISREHFIFYIPYIIRRNIFPLIKNILFNLKKISCAIELLDTFILIILIQHTHFFFIIFKNF